VNEGNSVKEYGSTGKQTCTAMLENHQMRGISVTLANAGGDQLFEPVHIAGGHWFRNARAGIGVR
jgi:hypothetical protein